MVTARTRVDEADLRSDASGRSTRAARVGAASRGGERGEPDPTRGPRATPRLHESVAIPLVARRAKASRAPSPTSLTMSGLFATSPDALRRRLIGPWAEGLRQYLTIRLLDERRGNDAFLELRRLALALPMSELVREPGAKARVYRLARRIAHERLARCLPSAEERPPYRIPDTSRAIVEALRRGLEPEDAELLELAHARELSNVEIACVLGRDDDAEDRVEGVASVDQALARAHARAEAIAHGAASGPREPLDPSILVATFALEPRREPSASSGAETRALEPGTLIGGRYRIGARVGVGAFGDVYAADDQDVPGHRVALKLLREPALSTSAREHALRELKLIAAVFHPSVVLFKDHGWFEDRLWFVMPWYEGATLDKRIEEARGLSRAEAHAIFEPLARALATLHASGIRHQDIKPENILLTRIRGFARVGSEAEVLPILIDLGVAAKDHEALVGGTPLYFAPEVAAHYAGSEDAPEIGPAADVFALALALRNALEPETEEEIVAGAIEAFIERRALESPRPPRRRELRYLERAFERWLHVDPARRPSAEELARELSILVAPEEARERRRRTLSWLAPLALAVLASFGALGWAYQRDASLQARRLHAARRETAEVRAGLLAEESRNEAISLDRADLLRRYERESLTREELAAHLGVAQRELDGLDRRLTQTLAARDALDDERGRLRHELAASAERVEQLEAVGEAERSRADDLDARLRHAREESARVQGELGAELSAAHARADRAAEDLRRAQGERDRADDHVRELEARLASAEVDREAVETRLAALRAEVTLLRASAEEGATTTTSAPRSRGEASPAPEPPRPTSPPSAAPASASEPEAPRDAVSARGLEPGSRDA